MRTCPCCGGEAIAHAATALRAGGVLIVETWDRRSLVARLSRSRWQQANPPSVMHLFTRDGLRRMATRHGFRVERLEATSKLVSPALVAGVVAYRSPRLASALRRAMAFTRITHLAIPYRLGDLVIMVAVKR